MASMVEQVNEGREAYDNGYPLICNPYNPGGILAAYWEAGWYEAKWQEEMEQAA